MAGKELVGDTQLHTEGHGPRPSPLPPSVSSPGPSRPRTILRTGRGSDGTPAVRAEGGTRCAPGRDFPVEDRRRNPGCKSGVKDPVGTTLD